MPLLAAATSFVPSDDDAANCHQERLSEDVDKSQLWVQVAPESDDVQTQPSLTATSFVPSDDDATDTQ
jgi:hypothetical protein